MSNKKNETQDARNQRREDIKNTFPDAVIVEEIKLTQKEIDRTKTRIDKLEKGVLPQFEGEKEFLINKLKNVGIEYVGKKAKISAEKIDKLAEEPEEKKIAEEAKEKIEEVKDGLESEFGENKSKESFAEDFETITVKRSNGSIEKDWKLMGIQDGVATAMKKKDSGEILRKFIPVKELELFNNKKYSEEEKELVNSEKNEEVLNKESSSEEVENKQEIEVLKMLKKELESLGINDEKLKGEAYKKFNELSSGSKLLVLKNLKGIILDEVTEESRSEARASVGEVKGLFGKIRKSLKENRLTNKSREEKLKELNKDGINENHEGKLNSLSEIISTLEIDVSEKNGKTEVSLLKTKEGMNEDQEKAIDELNLAANEFLSIPKEMAYESASKADQKKYEDARNKYLESRAKIVETLGASKENLSNLNKADLQLRMVRDFSNDSVLGEEWKQAVKNPGFFKKIISSMSSKEKAAYTASGYAVRSITGALSLSALVIPLMMGIGALRSNKRAKEKIKTQDKKAVYKEKKESPLALKRKSIKQQMDKLDVPDELRLDPEKWTKTNNKNQEDVKKYLKLRKKFLKLDEKLIDEQIESLNIASAESLVGKLDSLSERVKNEYLTESSKEKPDYNKLKELTESLRLRMMFTREKISKELVNFGSNENKALNYLDLQRSLDEAELVLAGEEINEILFSLEESNKNQSTRMDRAGVDGKFIAGKKLLDKILDRHAKDLSKERKNYIIKKTIYGALIAGAFAGVGALIREGKDLFSNIDTSDFEQGLTNNEDFEKAVMSGFSAINEANEVSPIDSVSMVNSANVADSTNFNSFNSESFIKDSGLEPGLGSAENYVEVNKSISEGLTLAGVDVENMSPKAIESLEKMGNVNKVVTLEKGNGVSKIFGGHMNNEYKVNFVDAKTGEVTEAAAFSRSVHPGDQVMLGEDGEVYVVCKNGVKNNPLYGAVKESIVNSETKEAELERIESVDMSGYKPELNENGKISFVKNNIVENQIIGENVVSSEVEGEIDNVNALKDWEVNLGNGMLIHEDGATLVGANEIPNFADDKVAGVEIDGDKYILKMKDGSSAVFNEMPVGEEAGGVELPKIYQFQEIIPASQAVDGLPAQLENLSRSLGENNWVELLKDGGFDLEMSNKIISVKDGFGHLAKIDINNINPATIDRIEPVYGQSGFGDIEGVNVFMKNGQEKSLILNDSNIFSFQENTRSFSPSLNNADEVTKNDFQEFFSEKPREYPFIEDSEPLSNVVSEKENIIKDFVGSGNLNMKTPEIEINPAEINNGNIIDKEIPIEEIEDKTKINEVLQEKDIVEVNTRVVDGDGVHGSVQESKQIIEGEDGEKITIAREVSNASVSGERLNLIKDKSDDLFTQLTEGNFKNEKSFLKYIADIKKSVSDQPLSEMEEKNWANTYKSYKNNTNPASLSMFKRKMNLTMSQFLSKY